MKLADIHIRDPFVLLHEDKYYLYGTRGATAWGAADGFDVYVSDDLENWSEPIEVFHNDGSFWATHNYWAPEVHQWRGAFYMFASFKKEDMCRGTAILKADSPLGPFVPHSKARSRPITGSAWTAPSTSTATACPGWCSAMNGCRPSTARSGRCA